MKLGDVAADVGKGLFAGAIGTAAMTESSTLEMKIRGRPASSAPADAPADAAAKVLGVEPKGEKEQARFSNLVHWGYGTGWGAARGLIGAAGLRGTGAAAAHFGAVWGSEQVMLPALGVAPPFWTWGVKEVGIDALHHLVYAGATSAAYAALDR